MSRIGQKRSPTGNGTDTKAELSHPSRPFTLPPGYLQYYGIPVQPKSRGEAEGGSPPPAKQDVELQAEGGFSGQPGEVPHRTAMENAFGRSFAGLETFTGPEAHSACATLGADAYTVSDRIAFGHDQPEPRLVAHELAHVTGIQDERQADLIGDVVASGGHIGASAAAGSADDGRVRRSGPGGAQEDQFPWRGKTVYSQVADLLRTPRLENYGQNKLADVPMDTEIKVVGKEDIFYRVRVMVNGREMEGYLATGQVEYAGPIASVTPANTSGTHPSADEAFVVLKRAETQRKTKGASFTPSADEQAKIDAAVAVLRQGGNYSVDTGTYRVSFARAAQGNIQINTIEDFILFVETVERHYPSATPYQIVTEIRQLWYSDVNWEVLIDSAGLTADDGKLVDIESKPHPLAVMFDMKTLAPKQGGKQIATSMGTVDIGHVMAGIDARLNGSPQEYPKERMKKHGHDSSDAELKWQTLHDFTDGDPRAAATWGGDLGQAYAEYIYVKYVKSEPARLRDYVDRFAKPAEILGDIHGYIAHAVWQKTAESTSAAGAELKVSNVLRDIYLVKEIAGGDTYQKYVEIVSGQKGQDLKQYVRNAAMSFAHVWYAKVAVADQGALSSGTSKREILYNHISDFSRYADENEATGRPEDTLEGIAEGFMRQLATVMK